MIGGLEHCSFIDYPGQLAAVVFLRGCNLRCPYCHNPELLARRGPAPYEEREILDFLETRRGRLDAVVVTGGEPTLSPRLRPLLEAVRQMGFKVKLDTNGTRPAVLAELLEAGLLDYVAMDLKDLPESYGEWLGLREDPAVLRQSLEFLRASEVAYELRTTVVLPRHDRRRLDLMAEVASSARRWVLRPYRPGKTLGDCAGFLAPKEEELAELIAVYGREILARAPKLWQKEDVQRF